MIEKYEGGYGWSTNDPGGPTRFGITCWDLAEHRHEKMTSMAAWAPIVAAMPLSEAEDIYATKYATACDFNDLGVGKDCVVFDFGVNSGPSTSIRYAQRIVGVTADGVLGPLTLTAINGFETDKFIDGLCDARLAFLRRLETWPVFGTGWSARIADLRAYSHGLLLPKPQGPLMSTPEGEMDLLPGAGAKGYHPDYIRELTGDLA